MQIVLGSVFKKNVLNIIAINIAYKYNINKKTWQREENKGNHMNLFHWWILILSGIQQQMGSINNTPRLAVTYFKILRVVHN